MIHTVYLTKEIDAEDSLQTQHNTHLTVIENIYYTICMYTCDPNNIAIAIAIAISIVMSVDGEKHFDFLKSIEKFSFMDLSCH